jgi:hypothetical protein
LPRKYDGTFILDANYDHNSIVEALIASIGKPFTNKNAGQLTSLCGPRGIFLDNKTFIVLALNPGFHPAAIMFNHVYKKWSGDPVQCGTTPSGLASDAHATAAIIADAQGYLHVFYGCHSDNIYPIKHSKSTNPKDISAWTTKTNLTSTQAPAPTYPWPIRVSNGDLYLFFRESCGSGTWARECYTKSVDNGETWSAAVQVIDFGDGYSIYHANWELFAGSPDKVWVAWTKHCWPPGSEKREDVYCAYLNLSDGKMYSPGGTDLGTTIDLAEADANCKAFESGASTASLPCHIHVNASGYPHIVFVHEVGAEYRYKYARWTGAAWSVVTIQDYNAGSQVALADFIINGSTIDMWLGFPTLPNLGESTASYGNIVQFRSTDSGVTWKFYRLIADGRFLGSPYYNPEVIKDCASLLKMVFTNLNTYFSAWQSDAQNYMFAWGDEGFV